MSFANDLRNELTDKIPSQQHCRLAELAGMMLVGGALEKAEDGAVSLSFSTEKENIAKKCFTFLKKSFNIDIVAGKRAAAGRRRGYVVRVPGERNALACAEEMCFHRPGGQPFGAREALADWKYSFPGRSCCAKSLLRGAFLAGGAMNDPDKSYHYEITVPTAGAGEPLAKALSVFGCEPKLWERRGSYAIYLKDAAQIADALTIMGATAARVRFEDIRVVRNKRAEVQRKVNCEVSNLAKTTSASNKQIEAIQEIERTVGIASLPEELQEMARVRLEYADASLQELGTHLNPPLARSGVNHRLQKLLGIAEGLRLKEGG
ncbi:MAG: DNA-binding protein WhiA [Lachnospiraceae bacterium]|nr:DNA-binding protein WhiA [Lachnospiraceae bacterium]